jgi:hypothetical protein
MSKSGGKWLQSIIFHSQLIVGIGTDGRTKSPNNVELWREMAGNPERRVNHNTRRDTT